MGFGGEQGGPRTPFIWKYLRDCCRNHPLLWDLLCRIVMPLPVLTQWAHNYQKMWTDLWIFFQKYWLSSHLKRMLAFEATNLLPPKMAQFWWILRHSAPSSTLMWMVLVVLAAGCSHQEKCSTRCVNAFD